MDYFKIIKACWENDIYVVQKPVKRGSQKNVDVTLYIDYKGKGKVEGSETYTQNSIQLQDAIEIAYRYAHKRFIEDCII